MSKPQHREILKIVAANVGLTAIWAAVAVAQLPRLPEKIAVHFSGTTPDNFGDPVTYIAGITGMAVLLSAFMCFSFYAVPPAPRNFHIHGGLTLAITSFLGFVTLYSLWIQRDLTDPAQAQFAPAWLLLGVIIAAGFFLLGRALINPAAYSGAASKTSATTSIPSLSVPPTAQVIWIGSGQTHWAVGMLMIVTSIGAMVLSYFVDSILTMVIGVITLVIALLILRVAVTTTDKGIRWALGGIIAKTIPWPEITGVELVTVSPGDYGGWGYRFNGESTAILLRGGPGIKISRRSTRPLVITVDDAEAAVQAANFYLTNNSHAS